MATRAGLWSRHFASASVLGLLSTPVRPERQRTGSHIPQQTASLVAVVQQRLLAQLLHNLRQRVGRVVQVFLQVPGQAEQLHQRLNHLRPPREPGHVVGVRHLRRTAQKNIYISNRKKNQIS